ncbi:MAG: MFS transporter [Deltaproteobacteria bacterium]|nr:MFS transporter [Deltaproteobacteria bacterium]
MRPAFFYGYVILALSFSNTTFVRGVSGAFSVFYVALLEDFGWSHGVGASIVSINSLVYALVSPLVGWAFDRLGPRALMPLGGLLIGSGLLMSGLSRSLWELLLAYGVVVAMGQGVLGFVSQSALISHWFIRRRGTAMGLATMGQGFGMLLLVPLAQFLISLAGWRAAFMVLGGVSLCALVPTNAFLQSRSPSEVGQLPDGDPPSVVDGYKARGHKPSQIQRWTLKAALRSFPFWTITVGHLALGTGLYIFYTHVVAHLVHEGFERLFAALALGLIGFVRIPGTSLWGVISDRLGRDTAYGWSVVITVAGAAGLAMVNPSFPRWFVYAVAVLFGLGHAAGNPTYGAVIGDIFGGSHVGTIFGFLEIGFGIGMALGSWLGGALFDVTGSYHWAFGLGVVTFTASYLAVRASINWQRRQEDWSR